MHLGMRGLHPHPNLDENSLGFNLSSTEKIPKEPKSPVNHRAKTPLSRTSKKESSANPFGEKNEEPRRYCSGRVLVKL